MNLLPCPSCSGRGAIDQYAPGLPFGFDDALGPTVDAPCEACGGLGYQTCLACDAPATVCDEHGVWCEGCAALNAPATERCPAIDVTPSALDDLSASLRRPGERDTVLDDLRKLAGVR